MKEIEPAAPFVRKGFADALESDERRGNCSILVCRTRLVVRAAGEACAEFILSDGQCRSGNAARVSGSVERHPVAAEDHVFANNGGPGVVFL